MSTRPNDRLAEIESEKKLQELVDYVDNLNVEEKALILKSDVRHFIPWRAVFSERSPSTPYRLVFDASQGRRGGYSLKRLLAKGANSMDKLVKILIRWRTYIHAYHTDLSKMYNRVLLEREFWRYQLRKDVRPIWKVIKTLIYGVRSSGNLTECALRRTAELCKDEYPRDFHVIT